MLQITDRKVKRVCEAAVAAAGFQESSEMMMKDEGGFKKQSYK